MQTTDEQSTFFRHRGAICYGVMGAGKQMALLDLGHKRHRRKGGSVWDMRSGQRRESVTGEAVNRPKSRVTDSMEYEPFAHKLMLAARRPPSSAVSAA